MRGLRGRRSTPTAAPPRPACGGRAGAPAPSRTNAHLWSRIAAAFEPGVFVTKKGPTCCLRQ
eukprot:5976812-Pyramimonas_sp.AAC.1